MKRKPAGLLVAFVLALIGTLLLVAYVQQARNQAVADERLVEVLVVQKPIGKGTPAEKIQPPLVKLLGVPANAKAADALTSLSGLKGKQTTIDLQPGEQVLASRFTTAAKSAEDLIGAGKVEVTVTLQPDRAVGGRVRIGDVVNLITTFPKEDQDPAFTQILLSNIKVTNVQTGTPPPATDPKSATPTTQPVNPAPSGAFMVTLAVTPADAERVVYAAEFGKLWLTAEGAVPPAGSRAVTRENVL